MAEKVTKIVLQSKDNIKKDQDGIRKGALNLDRSVHENAVQCLLHAETHGDTSLMRRLLKESLDGTGYRVQSLIAWMRMYSPMVLNGNTINLSGTRNGKKIEFQVAEANANPFWTIKALNERPIRPLYQDTLLSPILRQVAAIQAAMENTVNGKPVDPKKPFFDGLYGDKVVDFAQRVKDLTESLPVDATAEVRKAQQRIAEDTLLINAHDTDTLKVDKDKVQEERLTA